MKRQREEVNLQQDPQRAAIDAAREFVVSAGLRGEWSVMTQDRFFRRLVAALATLDEEEEPVITYVGPALPNNGWAHIVNGERTVCDLPIQPLPWWGPLTPPLKHTVCRGCLKAQAARQAG